MSWTDVSRHLSAKLEVQWDGSAWTDESANLLSAEGGRYAVPLWRLLGRTAETQKPAHAKFKLSSQADRYSPFNSSSPLYAYISANKGYGIPIRFSLSADAGTSWERVFTGRIDNLAIDSTKENRVTLSALSEAQNLIRKRLSTVMLVNQSPSAIIAYVAALAGITALDLSPGLTTVPFAWLDDESVLKELVKVAQADGGRLFFDRYGTLTYRNVEDWLTQSETSTVQHAFTVSRFRDLGARFDRLNVYNEVVTVYEPRGLSAASVVWSLPEVEKLAPGASKTISARYAKPVSNAALQNAKAIDFSGTDKTSSLTVTLSGDYAQQGDITLTNTGGAEYVSVVQLEVAGNPIIGRRSRQVKRSAGTSPIDDKSLFITRNEFLQTEAQAALVADFVQDVTQVVGTTYRFSAPFIPALEGAYRVSVAEAESGVNAEGVIQSVRWRYDRGTARANYEIIEFEIPDKNDYFEIGVSTLNGGKVAFY